MAPHSREPARAGAEAIALVGPTASGKTAVGMCLAQALGTQIVSVDSRQIYRLLDIGTAKPTLEERRRVAHHLVDVADPRERFSAARYARAARAAADSLRRRGMRPLFVGGTGLYLRAAREGLCPAPTAVPRMRAWITGVLARLPGGLHERLAPADPAAAARLHRNDVVRLVRAVEVYLISGEPLSRRQARHRGRERLPMRVFGLDPDASVLERMIRERLDAMVAAGFVEEVASLLAAGVDTTAPAMSAVGYPEIAAHVRGERTLPEAVESAARATRQYARRQLTWFRAAADVRWVQGAGARSPQAVAEEILSLARVDDGERGA